MVSMNKDGIFVWLEPKIRKLNSMYKIEYVILTRCLY